jgi:hypothetical protein
MYGVTQGGYYHIEKERIEGLQKVWGEYYLSTFNPPSTSSISVDVASLGQ